MKKEIVVLLFVLVLTGVFQFVLRPRLTGVDTEVLILVSMVLNSLLIIAGGNYLVNQVLVFYHTTKVSGTLLGIALLAVCAAVPELIISISAALRGEVLLPLNIIIGSNITSLLLVGGISTLIAYITFSSSTLTKEIPAYLVSIGLFFAILFSPFGSPYTIDRGEGCILLVVGIIFLLHIRTLVHRGISVTPPAMFRPKSIVSAIGIISSIAALYIGGTWIISDATALVSDLGFSSLFIGASVIALSTALPELVIAYTAARHHAEPLALGAILGSNMINLLIVSGISSMLQPLTFTPSLYRDVGYLFVCALLMFFVVRYNKHREIYHLSGFLMVGLYACYLIFLIHR